MLTGRHGDWLHANSYQRGTAALTRIAEVLDMPVGARYASAAASEPAQTVAAISSCAT